MPDSLATTPSTDSRLLDLASRVQREAHPESLLRLLLDAVMAVTGARNGAILERGSGDLLCPIVEVASSAVLPNPLVIRNVQSPLWSVLLGRATLRWSNVGQGPAPFRVVEGWDSGLVLRMTSRRGATRLVAVGGLPPADSRDVAQDSRIVQGMADIAAASLDGLELARSARRSNAILSMVTDLAGNMGAAESPKQLLTAITAGLNGLAGVQGARVWEFDEEGKRRLVAGSRDGEMPTSVMTERRLDSLGSPKGRTYVRQLLEAEAHSGPGEPLVSFATLPAEPRRVLGLAHNEPLDDLSRSVLRSLLNAIGPAMRTVEVAAERRNLLSSYTQALFPGRRPGGLDIAIELHPNTSAPGSFGGDFFDWFELADGRAAIALGDVAGKGIRAASAAGMAVWSLRATHAGVNSTSEMVERLAAVVENQLGMERFVTLAFLVVDSETWEVELILSGHPAPVVVQNGRGRVVEAVPNPPLGLIAGPVNSPSTFTLDPGEMIVLFTDGVTDAVDPEGERYGAEQVLSQASRISGEPQVGAEELAAELWYSVHAWAGGAPDDDCAILVVRRPD